MPEMELTELGRKELGLGMDISKTPMKLNTRIKMKDNNGFLIGS